MRAWILAVALAAALPYALKFAADNDLWWHVRTGQLILDERALPAGDPFSFTAAGAPWFNHEWLSDVVLALLFEAGGDRALTVWRGCLLLAVLLLLAALVWRRLPQPLAVLAAVLAVSPLVRILINLRPHSYTYLFLLLLLWLLESAGRRPRLLWAVPPLFALWANLHGGFVLGLGLLTVGLAARVSGLEDAAAQPATAERRRILAVWLLALAAPMLNPYGPALLGYLVRELGADHSLIMEWWGIWRHPEYRLVFVALCAVPVAALVAARTLRPLTPVVMLAVGALATWVHGRFLIVLVFFSCLVTVSAAAALLTRRGGVRSAGLLAVLRRPRWAWAMCAVPLLAALLQLGVDVRRKGLRLEIAPRLPVQSCEFLRRHDLGPRLLLRLDWGGYAIWHLHPRYRVSGDGRNLTVYDARLSDRLLRSYDEGRFGELAREYDVDVILSEAAGPVYHELLADRDWVPVHRDGVGAVWVPPEVARSLRDRALEKPPARPAAEGFYFP